MGSKKNNKKNTKKHSTNSKKSNSKKWTLARILALLGGIITFIGFIYGLALAVIATIQNPSVYLNIIYQIIGILITIMVFISVGVTKKHSLPYTWWMMLLYVIAQIILYFLSGTLLNVTGLGILLEIICVILLLIKAM